MPKQRLVCKCLRAICPMASPCCLAEGVCIPERPMPKLQCRVCKCLCAICPHLGVSVLLGGESARSRAMSAQATASYVQAFACSWSLRVAWQRECVRSRATSAQATASCVPTLPMALPPAAVRICHSRHDRAVRRVVPLAQHVLQPDVLPRIPCSYSSWSCVQKFLNTTRCRRPVFELLLIAGLRCQCSASNGHAGRR